MADPVRKDGGFEWPTLVLLVACYGVWALGTTWLAALWLPLGVVISTLTIALHSSLTHEMVHGHPFKNQILNEALVFPCLSLFVPYRRFRDLHLAHHQDSILTDPYDDPESNYMDPEVWLTLPRWGQMVLRFNNTLLGRLIVGPAAGLYAFVREDVRAMRQGDWAVTQAWVLQVPGVALVMWWLSLSAMPVWAYLIAAYAGFSILKIRTFLEHRAHERASGRTVVIEDRGPLALLFLNNNLHVVHHMHPKVAWYRLPSLWASNRDCYLRRNDGYYYRSYAEIFRKHFLRAKDPVPHPLWHKE
ncbi:fatty acid desaturase [Roseovarius rhodophyticola]|uniref:Fatty acid desaturase n=1 Tax=Roseovarius rhodophyticola TaxID=3080827 RepID=A0ABZ2THA1_9RHOB|nr:fatty acid desaturase [Roseovarius sp. W115]MDV2929254.1 fatty acid desaturase [Roseovarius sp. W115]